MSFKKQIKEGIPPSLPMAITLAPSVSHEPKRMIDTVLSEKEKNSPFKTLYATFPQNDRKALCIGRL